MEIKYDLSKLNNVPKPTNKNNMVFFVIESIHNHPYLYFIMLKNANDMLQLPYCTNIDEYMKEIFTDSAYDYKGCLEEKGENYVFYQLSLNEYQFTSTASSDVWWKVTPYEILYIGRVLQFYIDKKCSEFFKHNSEYLIIHNKEFRFEMPAVGYIGIGHSELNEQLLLENKNKRKGRFKSGYYFTTAENAYKHALYDINDTEEHIIKLANNNYITELIPIDNTDITIKHNQFYLGDIFLGPVPSHCKSNNKYELYYFDDDLIYLKTSHESACTTPHLKRRLEDGCMMRYLLFLGNHWTGTRAKKGYHSFAYDEEIMIKDDDNFLCLSYFLVDKNIEAERFKKDVEIQIK